MTDSGADLAKRSQQDEETGIDPGAMALITLAGLFMMAWLGLDFWQAALAGNMEAAWASRPPLVGEPMGLDEVFADPNEHGGAAYIVNWWVTFILFCGLLAALWAPSKFRAMVNEMVRGDSSER